MSKIFLLMSFFSVHFCYAAKDHEYYAKQLHDLYELYCHNRPGDIHEHIPDLKELASECSSAVEIGVRSMVSTWGILEGLPKSANSTYIGIDLSAPPNHSLSKAKLICQVLGIDFQFWQGNDMILNIPPVDMLFIDSLHTYCHLTFELEKFSPQVAKYIALHDTSGLWGEKDETCYRGNRSEYPAWIDRSKRGLWPAVVDFLERHPEWTLYRRKLNNNGFTVLKRKD